MGCFSHQINDGAFNILEGMDGSLMDDYKERRDPINKCYYVANNLGYTTFALQNGGMCTGHFTTNGSSNHGYETSKECKGLGTGGC